MHLMIKQLVESRRLVYNLNASVMMVDDTEDKAHWLNNRNLHPHTYTCIQTTKAATSRQLGEHIQRLVRVAMLCSSIADRTKKRRRLQSLASISSQATDSLSSHARALMALSNSTASQEGKDSLSNGTANQKKKKPHRPRKTSSSSALSPTDSGVTAPSPASRAMEDLDDM